jgi:hypothetical protein
LVGGDFSPEVIDAAKSFDVPLFYSDSGKELLGDSSWTTFFIVSDFQGPVFDEISGSLEKHK